MLKYRKIFFFFSSLLVVGSIASLVIFGLKLGIDFTGGSLLELEIKGLEITPLKLEQALESQTDLSLGDVQVQPTPQTFIIRLREINEDEHQKILEILGAQYDASKNSDESITEKRFESIGPVVGSELKRKALWQILLVAAAIVFYLAWAFRKVSELKEKSKISWKFGLAALLALLHDVTITVGVFAILGKVLAVEINNSFIAAVLLVLGYSVNDTIVVFDRIRENMIKNKYSQNLEAIINNSISETVVRSLNTSATTLLVLFAILLFGGSTVFYFVLALIIGITVGTYSSIFLAAPLLYEWEK